VTDVINKLVDCRYRNRLIECLLHKIMNKLMADNRSFSFHNLVPLIILLLVVVIELLKIDAFSLIQAFRRLCLQMTSLQ
jgi:hypothetical protein